MTSTSTYCWFCDFHCCLCDSWFLSSFLFCSLYIYDGPRQFRSCIARVLIESCGSRFSNYFLEPGKRFSNSENWQQKPDNRPAKCRAVKSPPVMTHLLSVLDCLCVNSRAAVCIPECTAISLQRTTAPPRLPGNSATTPPRGNPATWLSVGATAARWSPPPTCGRHSCWQGLRIRQWVTDPGRTGCHCSASIITTVQTETQTSPRICALSTRNEISWELTSLCTAYLSYTVMKNKLQNNTKIIKLCRYCLWQTIAICKQTYNKNKTYCSSLRVVINIVLLLWWIHNIMEERRASSLPKRALIIPKGPFLETQINLENYSRKASFMHTPTPSFFRWTSDDWQTFISLPPLVPSNPA